MKTNRLISLILVWENLASRRVAERMGMTVWKEVNWHGHPHCVYSIDRTTLCVKLNADQPACTKPQFCLILISAVEGATRS